MDNVVFGRISVEIKLLIFYCFSGPAKVDGCVCKGINDNISTRGGHVTCKNENSHIVSYWASTMYLAEKVAEKKYISAIVTFQNVSYICMSFCASFQMDRDVT